MKPTALIINTGRRSIIDEQARLNAPKAGQIAGAVLIVFSQEPLMHFGHPLSELYGMDNVIISPHLTFYTKESMHRLEEETITPCFEALEGRPIKVKSSDPRFVSQEQEVSFK